MISIIGITISLLGTKQTSETEILSDIIIYLLLIAIGIGLLAFQMLLKGNVLENENNLTI
jgi:hypothetical protein